VEWAEIPTGRLVARKGFADLEHDGKEGEEGDGSIGRVEENQEGGGREAVGCAEVVEAASSGPALGASKSQTQLSSTGAVLMPTALAVSMPTAV
jgi:hypothetical protein